MTHTPGPWHVYKNRHYVMDSRSHLVAYCGDVSVDTREEVEANAILIASAPDLLEALENIASGHACLLGFSIDDAAEIARDALAKARGE